MSDQKNNGGAAGASGEKHFTQEDVNAIVSRRLAEEGRKYSDYEELRQKAEKYDQYQASQQTDLEKAQGQVADLQRQLDALNKANSTRQIREKASMDTGVPVELLTADTEDECKALADKILKFAQPAGYPGTKSNKQKQNSGNNNGSSNDGDAFREFARELFNKGE